MTALAGVWRFDQNPEAASECSTMLAAQRLYGPDATAQWSDGGVALGRQLMRLLPEDSFDRQPLIGEGGRHVLVADLRLDNRHELAEQLQLCAAEASGLADSAILLAAFERWGVTCAERLIGDFAFALWDSRQRRIFLARDPLGQRPLHYHCGDAFFAFASMPKGLHALAAVPYELDEECIAESLLLMPAGGARTYFQGIQRVLPGHIVTVTRDSLASRRYWQPSEKQLRLSRSEEYFEGLRSHLDQAVKCRLRGAKDVGAELSGGLDSSAVAATAARLLASSGGRVVAFTAVPRDGYDGPAPPNRIVDEWPQAAATTALYSNMDHVPIRSDGISPLDTLDRNFFLFEEPVIAICNAPWGRTMFDAARKRNLTVLLNGMCGNMGLSADGAELLAELFRSGRWLHLWRESRALIAKQGMRWRGVLLQTLGPWCPESMWLWIHRIAGKTSLEPTVYSGINPARLREFDVRSRRKDHGLDIHYRPQKNGRASRLSALQRSDMGNFNKGVLAGWHIDRRDPTSDIRLLEFCLSVPSEHFLQNGVPRALARRAFSDRLPELIVKETRRGLQAADWHESLSADRDRLGSEIERLSSCPPAVRALDLPRLRRLVENWPKDGWGDQNVIASYRLALAAGISTGHFIRRVTGTNS